MNSINRRLAHAVGAALLVALSVQPGALADDQQAPADRGAAQPAPAAAETPADQAADQAPADAAPADPGPADPAPADPAPAEVAPAEGAPADEAPVDEAPAAEAPAAVAPADEAAQPEAGVGDADEANEAAAPAEANVEQRQAAAADCVASDRGDAITSITVSPTIVAPNDIVNVNFTGLLADGGCTGDFILIPLPPELRGLSGTFPVTTPDGSPIATMVVSGGQIRITFNSYVEANTNIRFSGFVLAQVRSTVTPDTTYDLEWPVGGGFVTPVTTEPCDNCGGGQADSRKFAIYEEGPPPYIRWAIASGRTQTANETVVITDSVSTGQAIDCATINVRVGTTLDNWGHVIFGGAFAHTVNSCTTTSVSVTITATAIGQYFQLEGRSTVTAVQREYVDNGTVRQAGQTDLVRATARLSDGGGQVDGVLRRPRIDIEKWSTNQGIGAGDHDDDPKHLQAGESEQLTFTITNTGNERLRNIVVRDRTTAGTGTVRNLSCDFSPLGGPSSGTSWSGPFEIRDSFTCTGTLPKLGPGANHTNLATVSATGSATGINVDDKDPWMAVTPGGGRPNGPEIDIEKWSTNQGPKAGDHDHDPAQLAADRRHRITLTVTNVGKEALENIKISDRTIAGVGEVTGLTCDFSRLGGPKSGTTWAGPFKVGERCFCTGTLSGLPEGEDHTDRASATGTGVNSGTPVRDTDDWMGQTAVAHSQAGPGLPATGAPAGLIQLSLAGLALIAGGAFLIRQRRRS
ncbi:MAG: Ig-like domain-containing protein [Nocardioides sp.]